MPASEATAIYHAQICFDVLCIDGFCALPGDLTPTNLEDRSRADEMRRVALDLSVLLGLCCQRMTQALQSSGCSGSLQSSSSSSSSSVHSMLGLCSHAMRAQALQSSSGPTSSSSSSLQSIMPGPRPLAVLGNLLEWQRFGDVSEMLASQAEKFGDISVAHTGMRFGIGSRPVYFVADPELVREVTVKQSDVFANRDCPHHSVAATAGLVTAQGETHCRFRTALNPLFLQPAQLSTHVVAVTAETAAMMSSLTAQCSDLSAVLESRSAPLLLDHLNIWAVNVLFRVMYSVSTAVPYPIAPAWSTSGRMRVSTARHYAGALKRSFVGKWGSRSLTRAATIRVHASQLNEQLKQGLTARNRSFMGLTKAFTNRGRQIAKTRQQLRAGVRRRGRDRRQGTAATAWLELSNTIIAERIAAVQSVGIHTAAAVAYGDDVLGQLLAGKIVSHAEVPAIMRDILIAGSDTVSAAAAATLWQIAASQPHVRTALTHELQHITAQTLSYTQMTKQLPYLTACVKESLRLHSSSPTVFRVAGKDTKLAGYSIPSGAGIIMSTKQLGTSQQHWSQPREFIPERHLVQQQQQQQQQQSSEKYTTAHFDANRHAFSWLPFGAGHHACLGSKLGVLEIVTVTATLLTHVYGLHTATPVTAAAVPVIDEIQT